MLEVMNDIVSHHMTVDESDMMNDRDELFQVSILQALSLGDYHGFVSVEEFKTRGDIGLGTFNRLNGEMIMIDGIVYRADGEGNVIEVENDSIPFGNAAFIEGSEEATVSADSINTLRSMLNDCILRKGINHMYVIRIDGLYDSITIRSIRAQEEPYQPLARVITEQQRIWMHESVKGTIVGFHLPSYLDKVNTDDWHLHFISEDRKIGGHVLDATLGAGSAKIKRLNGLHIRLPDDGTFEALDLDVDQKEDIKRIEG